MAYKNKEKEKENKRIYYLKNRDIILTRSKKWNFINHIRYIERLRNYRNKSNFIP